VSSKEQKKPAGAATSSPKTDDTISTKMSKASPWMERSSPQISDQLLRREIWRPSKGEPIRKRSLGRLNSKTGSKYMLTSVSTASPDPEDSDWDRDSVGAFDDLSKTTQSIRRSGNGRSLRRDVTASLLLPNMMSAATLSIGSADPELFDDISEWDVKKRGFSLASYRESAGGKFGTLDDSIALRVGVMVCNSFQQYHLRRDEIISTPYEIHLEEYNKKWARDAAEVCKWLWGMDSSKKYWHKVQHIGSTSIPDMVAKPIIDIMITLKEEDKFKEAVDEFLHDQFEIKKLPVKIGFTGKAPFSHDNWGFFQVPQQSAEKFGICEVNIHIFNKNSTNALEKNLFRDYLTCTEGHELKKEYCAVKRKLMEELNEGLKVADYALRKNEIVSKILDKAYLWNFKNEDVKEPVLAKPKRLKHSTTCPTDIQLSRPEYSTPREAKEEKSGESKSNIKEQERKSRLKPET